MFRREEGYSSSMQSPAPVTVDAEYDVEIVDISRKGDGVARIEGFVVFIAGTTVGDQAKIQVDRVMNRFAIGHKI